MPWYLGRFVGRNGFDAPPLLLCRYMTCKRMNSPSNVSSFREESGTLRNAFKTHSKRTIPLKKRRVGRWRPERISIAIRDRRRLGYTRLRSVSSLKETLAKANFRPQVEGATCRVGVPPTRHEAGPCDS